MDESKKQKHSELKNINLYTALTIFINNAPHLIDFIIDAAGAGDLSQTEEIAARLSRYSSNAQLTGFTKNINKLIIAARERKASDVLNEAKKLNEIFAQMTKCTNKTMLEQRIALEEKTAQSSTPKGLN